MHRDLPECYRLLPQVSRTFALNIRILPGELRGVVTVAYLLFRYADTLEDKPGLSTVERSALFDAFLDRLDGRGPLELPETLLNRLLAMATPAETDLVLRGERIFRILESFPIEVQEIIGSHVAETARGMERITRSRTNGGLLQLQTWQDLDEYCYYVAGTIGIMLTRLFSHYSRHIDAPSRKRLTALSTSFGRGLQLTNIVKGIGVDRREGRVYLPAEALAVKGVSPRHLLNEDARAGVLTVVNEIVPKALQDLEDALRYTLLLPRREPRLRLFCLWPLFTAVRTLALTARGTTAAQPDQQPKISRVELIREMALSGALVFSNTRLRRRFERFRRELFPNRARIEVWAG
jgi:farnesyl-diphosphate farnesyltransferase